MSKQELKEQVMSDIQVAKDSYHTNLEFHNGERESDIEFTMGHQSDETPFKFGDVVMASLIAGQRGRLFDVYVGYVVQVRRGFGQFGSDMLFIRHPDGSLVTHENQSFYRLNRSLRDQALECFDFSPEQELESNPNLTYTVKGGHSESGFVIKDVGKEPITPPSSFTVTVTSEQD